MIKHKGDTWNESSVHTDAETGRTVRRLTTSGLWNEKPTYHTNTAFSADGESLIFARAHEGRTAMLKCHVPTGELTQLTDPVDGVGSPWGVHKIGGESEYFDGRGISGIMACIAPKSRRVVFGVGRSVRIVHLDTFEEMMLLEDFGCEWVDGAMSVDPSETHALLPLMPAHPEVLAGREPTKSYVDTFAEGGMVTRYVEIPLDGGASRIAFEDDGMGCAHCPHSPVDDDLILIDRDRPPIFWGGGDHGASTRCWTLRLSTGELTELRPRNDQRFQVHAAWTWDGECVVYHGFMREGGYYIGVIDKSGQVIQEYDLPDAGAYGHVSAAPDRPAIVLDGNVTEDKLTWIYYDRDEPRFETIATHGTEWRGIPGQYSDPHPQTDPTGRHIAYHVAKNKRTDIYAVTV
ncbi:MAG: TolB-like translocation protein [Planctomycetota bacterium]